MAAFIFDSKVCQIKKNEKWNKKCKTRTRDEHFKMMWYCGSLHSLPWFKFGVSGKTNNIKISYSQRTHTDIKNELTQPVIKRIYWMDYSYISMTLTKTMICNSMAMNINIIINIIIRT